MQPHMQQQSLFTMFTTLHCFRKIVTNLLSKAHRRVPSSHHQSSTAFYERVTEDSVLMSQGERNQCATFSHSSRYPQPLSALLCSHKLRDRPMQDHEANRLK